MIVRIDRGSWMMLALALAACGPPPPPPPPPGPSQDELDARKATDLALASLSKRNFEVRECTSTDARLVSEAEARAGAPIGERCTMLVAHKPDRAWLVVVRSATTDKPTRAGGSRAIVTVLRGLEGVTSIEYQTVPPH